MNELELGLSPKPSLFSIFPISFHFPKTPQPTTRLQDCNWLQKTRTTTFLCVAKLKFFIISKTSIRWHETEEQVYSLQTLVRIKDQLFSYSYY